MPSSMFLADGSVENRKSSWSGEFGYGPVERRHDVHTGGGNPTVTRSTLINFRMQMKMY